MNVAKLASQSSAALNEGIAIVRKVIKSLPPSARFTTSELYQLALKESPSPTFKPFLRSGNRPTVHGIGLPSSKPGPKPPHPDHPISSKTFLKREILPVLEGKREIKLVSAPRLPSRPPAPQNGKQGKAAQKQAKNSAPPLPASTVSGWVWKPVEKTELHTVRKASADTSGISARKRALGAGEDWSHLSKRRQRARVRKVQMDIDKLSLSGLGF
ncbi:hypothetical protein AB1N83_009567 [Pleurotus pulmonarius]|nr:hypothetical protein EYR38_002636 [Pleurotus pulmonarius]